MLTGRLASVLLLSMVLVSAWPGLATAGPACQLRGRPWLEGRVRGTLTTGTGARAVDARIGEEIEVFLMAPGLLDGRQVVFSEDGGRGHVSYGHAGCGQLAVSWRRVEPHMQHVNTPAPNHEIKVYANAQVFGPNHGKWIGFDRLEYFETPLPAESGPTLVVRDARPTDPALAERAAPLVPLGTMRLMATVKAGDKELSTPGAEDAPAGIIADRVFRYSFRRGDGFLGWLTSFFNVPYLFGSAGKGSRSQAERYQGADCADILVAALRRAGRRDLDYSSVAGLVDSMHRVAGPVLVRPCEGPNACPASADPPLRFGRDVRPGDLLALDYVDAGELLPRSWDHIVVLVEDRGPGGVPDGVLGPEDLVGDSGDALGLKFAPLSEQGVVRVAVLRPKGAPVL